MPVFLVVAVGAVVGLFLTVAIWQYKKNQARIASLAALCASEGWQFSPQDPHGLVGRWDGTPFDSGYGKRAENVITGGFDGRPMVAFDYSYKEDSTDSKGHSSTTTYHFGIVALRMPCALPELHVSPEGVLSRIGQLVGFQDIELESEDFNRRFRVRCVSRKLATDILTPRTMELLLANGKIRFRLVGTDALCYESGMLDPVEILRSAHVLRGVIAGVPQFVWNDHSPAPRNAQ